MTAVPFDVPCGDAASRRAARADARLERRAARKIARDERRLLRRIAWDEASIINARIRDRRELAELDVLRSWAGSPRSRPF